MEGKTIYLVRHPVADLYLGERGWALAEHARLFFQKEHALRHAFVNDGFVVEAKFVLHGASDPPPGSPSVEARREHGHSMPLVSRAATMQPQPFAA